MFYFLNKHSGLQLALSLGLLIWAWLTIFTQMTFAPVKGPSFLYQAIAPIFLAYPLLMKVTASLMLLLVVFFLQRFFTQCKFSENQTYMPILLLLLLLNAGHFLTRFTPAFFTLFFFSLVNVLMIRVEYDKLINNRIYSVGMLVALATLLDVQAVWMVLFLVIALFSNRVTKSKEIIILFLGMVLVYIYLFMFFFMSDRLPEMVEAFRHFHFFEIIRNFTALRPIQYGLGGYLVLLLILNSVVVKVFFDNKLIVLRKRLVTTLFHILSCILMLLFSGLAFHDSLLYLMGPLGLLLSMLCLVKRRKFVHDVELMVLCVLLWL